MMSRTPEKASLMYKTWLIIKREYITRVRKKSFVLMTLLAPFGMALPILFPLLVTNLNSEQTVILVDDPSGAMPSDLPDSLGIEFHWASMSTDRDSLIPIYENNYDGLLSIAPRDSTGKLSDIKLYTTKRASMQTLWNLERALENAAEQKKLEELGLKREDIVLRPNLEIESIITGRGNKRENGSAIAATAVGYGMGFLMYIVLLIYGTMVMRGVMEEKTNRIVEVIVTSVRPFQLMMGKIMGIAGVGLTQFSVWVILGAIIQLVVALSFPDQFEQFNHISQSDPLENTQQMRQMAKAYQSFAGLPFFRLFLIFAFYFLGGYLLYSALFAAIGSLANDDGGDVQTYSFPVTLPIIISIALMIVVIQRPNSSLAFWASVIPFTSPIVMPARVPFIGINWEVGLSMLLLVLGFTFTTAMAGKIYRTAILMYGKKIRPSEVWKWLTWKS